MNKIYEMCKISVISILRKEDIDLLSKKLLFETFETTNTELYKFI